MIKRILTAVVLAGCLTSSAFATDARENVLFHGDGGMYLNKGSFYYDDAYNMFYNPAYVNDSKNWVTFEKSGNNTGEGGFVTSMSNFNMGLYFNRQASNTYAGTETANTNLIRNTYATTNGTATGMNPIDFIIGGDSGVKWGLGLTYASFNSSKMTMDGNTGPGGLSTFVVRAGVSVADFDPFLEWRPKDGGKVSGAAAIEEKNTDMSAGLRYHWGEWVPYAVYSTAKQSVTATADSKETTWVAGFGRSTKLGGDAHLMYSLSAGHDSTGADGAKVNNFIMPVNMGIEADATTWLTLRAGMQYDLFHHTGGAVGAGSSGSVGTDNVLTRVGGTFHCNKVDVEYAFGTNTATPGAPTNDSNSVGFDSGTFHTIALNYKW